MKGKEVIKINNPKNLIKLKLLKTNEAIANLIQVLQKDISADNVPYVGKILKATQQALEEIVVKNIPELEKELSEKESYDLLILFGKSGVGKSYISEILQKNNNFHIVTSYTTRENRPDDKKENHIFISIDDYNDIKDKLIFDTKYENIFYGVDFTLLKKDKINVCIIDPIGIIHFFNKSMLNQNISSKIREVKVVKIKREKNQVLQTILKNNFGAENVTKELERMERSLFQYKIDLKKITGQTIHNFRNYLSIQEEEVMNFFNRLFDKKEGE